MIPFDASTTTTVGPIAATVWSSRFNGIALVDPHTGAIRTKVETFTNPAADQAGGAYDGYYAVWKDMSVAGNPDEWTMKVWDAATGRVRVVGASGIDAHGQPISGSWQNPLVGGGYAAWVQSLDNSGGGEIRVLDLRTDRLGVARRGHPGWIALSGRSLIWSESPKPGALTALHAIDLGTDRSEPVPTPLRDAVAAWGFVTNGSSWVWVAGTTPTAYVGLAGSTRPIEIGVVPQGGASPPLTITNSMAEIPVSAGGAMLINLRTLAWTYVPDIAGSVASGDRLFASRELTGSKTSRPANGLAEVSTPALDDLRCN